MQLGEIRGCRRRDDADRYSVEETGNEEGLQTLRRQEDDRADDPVAKVWRSPSIGPMELQRLLSVLAARRQTVDEDLRRLIAAAGSIGMLYIVVKARTTLAGSDCESESANS